jgi:anti-anti-sigma regulatory factor
MSKVSIENKTNGVFVVTIGCAIDFETYQDVKSAIKPLLAKTTRVIIVDMKTVNALSGRLRYGISGAFRQALWPTSHLEW